MTTGTTDWRDEAWALVLAGDYAAARESAMAMIAQADSEEKADFKVQSVTVGGRSIRRRADEIADAEEILAAADLLQGDHNAALGRAQRAVLWSERFRAGAHLVAAEALRRTGQRDLYMSKLDMVAEKSDDMGVRTIALIQLRALDAEPQ